MLHGMRAHVWRKLTAASLASRASCSWLMRAWSSPFKQALRLVQVSASHARSLLNLHQLPESQQGNMLAQGCLGCTCWLSCRHG